MGRVIRTICKAGENLPAQIRTQIREALLSGLYPNKAELARRFRVTPNCIYQMLRTDPDLKEAYEIALKDQADKIAETAVALCLDDEFHPIAREKLIETMLPKLDPERFGENADLLQAASGTKQRRIIIAPVLPVVAVDENGIPVKKDEAVEAQEVKSESPLDAQ